MYSASCIGISCSFIEGVMTWLAFVERRQLIRVIYHSTTMNQVCSTGFLFVIIFVYITAKSNVVCVF